MGPARTQGHALTAMCATSVFVPPTVQRTVEFSQRDVLVLEPVRENHLTPHSLLITLFPHLTVMLILWL